jgi:hypothetical protein
MTEANSAINIKNNSAQATQTHENESTEGSRVEVYINWWYNLSMVAKNFVNAITLD